MKRTYIFPVLLILIGVILLLNQFDFFDMSRAWFLILGSAAIGGLLIRKAYLSEKRQGLLGGTFFILLALTLLSLDWGYLPFYDSLILGIIIFNLGLANFVYYFFTRKSAHNITSGIVFCAIGLPFIILYYGSFDVWDIADLFSNYWPLLLITAGFGFLIDGMFKKAK